MKYSTGCNIKKFVNSMTLQQKIALQATLTAITSEPISELGIPAMCIADGVTGISYLQVYLDRIHTLTQEAPCTGILLPGGEEEEDRMIDEVLRDPDKTYQTAQKGTLKYEIAKILVEMKPRGQEPTCFPSGVVLGSTWNPELVKECGTDVGREMAIFGVDVVLGPNVDIQRDPLCGRGYECYSEDPFLVGEIGSSFIRGMQSTGVAACAKHFAANNQETNRNSINALISERALREIYLRGFESAVKDGGVKSIMMAYNKVNGVHCAESSRFMKDIIRDDWGFEGCIVSDWGAAKDEPISIKAGMDLILPARRCDIEKAIADGEMSEEDLDRCVVRILQMYESLNGMTGRPDPSEYNDSAAVKCVYDCIVDGAVLLKNDGVLPLEHGTKTIFWGKRSKQMIDCGGGSTQVFTKKSSSVLERAKVVNGSENCFYEEMAEGAEAFIYTAAYPGHEDMDHTCLLFEHEDRVKIAKLLRQAKENGLKTIVVLNTAGPVDMRDWLRYADAVLCVYLPGCEGGNAVSDMIYGIAAPGGRLSQTFPVKYEDTPACINFPGENGVVNYGEGIFVGYRYYDKKGITPAFSFGHGLTYTTFEMNTQVTAFSVSSDENLQIDIPVTVRNTGKRTGSEVVQLYVGQSRSYVQKPIHELKGFRKLLLNPGEEKTVTITLNNNSFRHYDEDHGGWCIEPGDYTIYIGHSSTELPITIPVRVTGDNPYGIGGHTSINKIAQNNYAIECLCRIVPDFRERLPQFLHEFDKEPLIEVYDSIMHEYYINPIQGSIMFKAACKNMNEKK